MIAGRLQDLVSAQAERTPENAAVVFGDRTISYRDLDSSSNQLGRLLLESGRGKGDRVCLFVPKGIEAIVGMLGILKAGCAYVPIDLESPPRRAQRIVSSAEPSAVLVARAGSRLLDECLSAAPGPSTIISTEKHGLSGPYFSSDADFSDLGALDAGFFDSGASDTDLAHLLFTSGSTGVPKGVMITHRNVVKFVQWATRYFDIQAGEQISGHPPLHFDLSTFDIFGSLSRGATLHLTSPQLNLVAPKLAEWMRTSRLTQWFSVPSILTYMAKFDVIRQNDFPDMKRLLWCGEVLPIPTLQYWMDRLPHVSFTNLYGPTEATIASSYYTVDKAPTDERENIPIGVPCDGEDLLVLDEELRPVPPDTVGDLYIRGAGLSPGYWRDAEKTGAAFLPNPNDPEDRIYKTGDLGRVDELGFFHYVGRVDSQIKSRGHRIELGEVETALNSLGCLRECAVVGVETGGFEGAMICCAYVSDRDQDVSPPGLRHQLAQLVPRYMLPSRWRDYEQLPKNANGKIDRSKIRGVFEQEILN